MKGDGHTSIGSHGSDGDDGNDGVSVGYQCCYHTDHGQVKQKLRRYAEAEYSTQNRRDNS